MAWMCFPLEITLIETKTPQAQINKITYVNFPLTPLGIDQLCEQMQQADTASKISKLKLIDYENIRY